MGPRNIGDPAQYRRGNLASGVVAYDRNVASIGYGFWIPICRHSNHTLVLWGDLVLFTVRYKCLNIPPGRSVGDYFVQCVHSTSDCDNCTVLICARCHIGDTLQHTGHAVSFAQRNEGGILHSTRIGPRYDCFYSHIGNIVASLCRGWEVDRQSCIGLPFHRG